MKIIVRARAAGKTTELIRMSAEKWVCIVCLNHERCSEIALRAKEMGLRIPFPLSFSDLLEEQYNSDPKANEGFLIDDADQLIQSISKVPILAITMTGNTQPIYNPHLNIDYNKYLKDIDTPRDKSRLLNGSWKFVDKNENEPEQ